MAEEKTQVPEPNKFAIYPHISMLTRKPSQILQSTFNQKDGVLKPTTKTRRLESLDKVIGEQQITFEIPINPAAMNIPNAANDELKTKLKRKKMGLIRQLQVSPFREDFQLFLNSHPNTLVNKNNYSMHDSSNLTHSLNGIEVQQKNGIHGYANRINVNACNISINITSNMPHIKTAILSFGVGYTSHEFELINTDVLIMSINGDIVVYYNGNQQSLAEKHQLYLRTGVMWAYTAIPGSEIQFIFMNNQSSDIGQNNLNQLKNGILFRKKRERNENNNNNNNRN